MRLLGCLASAVCLLLLTSALKVSGQCSTAFTYKGITKNFQACVLLTSAPSGSLAWTQTNTTLEVGYTGTAASATNSWAAWGINPSTGASDFMPGATAFLVEIDAAGVATVAVRNLAYGALAETPAGSTFVPNVQLTPTVPPVAEVEGTTVKIYASVEWTGQEVFHGWNNGPLSAGTPLPHESLLSKGIVNLASGVSSEGGDIPNQKLKYTHGILAVVSWGVLIPLGIMVARYARPFEACRPAWFYTHILLQLSGFILGVTAWGIGLKLGNDSVGVEYDNHRAIGLVVFIFSILQVLALVLRPDVENKTVRPYWNVYHHTVGYVAAVLAIVNIFIGFHILKEQGRPKTSYRNGYIAVLAVFGGIAFVLEVFTWIVYFRRKSQVPSQKMGDEHGLRPSVGYT